MSIKLFLHTVEKIRIINESQDFSCTPEEFQGLEPDYAGAPDIYWTPAFHTPNDAPDCSAYVERIASYIQQFPVIYAHVSLSKTLLNVDLPGDAIQFTARLKADIDPASPTLPVEQNWVLRLSHENGLNFDAFWAEFTSGECQKSYTYRTGTPLGKWFVNENIFDKVTVGGATYQVRLAAPVEFAVYRELN